MEPEARVGQLAHLRELELERVGAQAADRLEERGLAACNLCHRCDDQRELVHALCRGKGPVGKASAHEQDARHAKELQELLRGQLGIKAPATCEDIAHANAAQVGEVSGVHVLAQQLHEVPVQVAAGGVGSVKAQRSLRIDHRKVEVGLAGNVVSGRHRPADLRRAPGMHAGEHFGGRGGTVDDALRVELVADGGVGPHQVVCRGEEPACHPPVDGLQDVNDDMRTHGRSCR